MSLLESREAQLLLEDAVVSASTVHGCRRRLAQFLQRYLPLFYRAEQREHAKVVVQGRLSHLQRKTCEPIAREAGVERKPIQLFVGGGKWDDDAVMSEMRSHVTEHFHDPEATFVLDPSGFPKKGTESCGVKRQWSGRLGKVDNCQVGVFLSCVSQGRAAPLGRRLYLPRDWAKDTARRRKCHVPSNVCFAEKWRIALKLVQEARHVPHGWIVADDELGRVSQFRAKLRKRGERYVLDVPCNTLVRVPEMLATATTMRKGKTKKRGRPQLPSWVRVDQWAARQSASRWQRIEVRAGEKGPLVVEVLHAAVEVRDKSRERLLVIRTVEATPKTHYSLSNAREDVSVERIVAAHGDRHRIEEMFEAGNGEVGLDHYEVRSWVGWHHHITLSLLSLWFLMLERDRVGKKNSGYHSATSPRNLQSTDPTAAAHGTDHSEHHHAGVAA